MSDVDSAQKVYKTYLMVDNFIEILMENEKSGANEYTFGLKSKKDYEQLLKPVTVSRYPVMPIFIWKMKKTLKNLLKQ